MIIELAIANLKQDFRTMNCPECKSNKIHKNGNKRGKLLPNSYDAETIPQVGELDELETFVGQKKTKSGFGRR